jgi:hypothetical protein
VYEYEKKTITKAKVSFIIAALIFFLLSIYGSNESIGFVIKFSTIQYFLPKKKNFRCKNNLSVCRPLSVKQFWQLLCQFSFNLLLFRFVIFWSRYFSVILTNSVEKILGLYLTIIARVNFFWKFRNLKSFTKIFPFE